MSIVVHSYPSSSSTETSLLDLPSLSFYSSSFFETYKTLSTLESEFAFKVAEIRPIVTKKRTALFILFYLFDLFFLFYINLK